MGYARLAALGAALLLAVWASPEMARAESPAESPKVSPLVIGSVTRQPLPRWVSMKAEEAFARRGPSMNHRIDWVFKHRNMPLQVTAEHGHWRRVEDRDGVGGWVHYVLLSRARTVIVEEDMLPLRRRPDPASTVVARAQLGAIAQLKECRDGWCRIQASGQRGWVLESGLWGTQAAR